MKLKVYEYKKCSTCRKALKFLDGKKIAYEVIDITERPPSSSQLKKMLKHYDGNLKKLLNTSGQMYRELNLKETLPDMSQNDVLQLLAKNGKLVKRPFVLSGSFGMVGFKEDEWLKNLS